MNNLNKRNSIIIDKINELLTLSYDAFEGYDLASDNTDDSTLQTFFQKYRTDRLRFITDLSLMVIGMGGKPVSQGSWKGKLHRSWMNLRDLVANQDTNEMLEEAIRGEKAALAEYSELLDDNSISHDEFFGLLRRQRDEIKGALNTMRSMMALEMA